MTKKHYEVIAYRLNETRPYATAEEMVKYRWAKDVIAVANALAEFNPRFNRNKFYEACGGIDAYLE